MTRKIQGFDVGGSSIKAGLLDVEGGRVAAFPMEGRLPNEWECPLDYGEVKREIGVGPIDRLLLFVGPLEHAAGVDVLLEALPVLLQRYHNLRLAFIGAGPLHGQLQHRAHQLGVAHAVRLLGHVEGGAGQAAGASGGSPRASVALPGAV